MENNTKLRILRLYRYLLQNTDFEHPQSTAQLMKMLKERYGISVSRNTISDDLTLLVEVDAHIKIIHSTQNKYYYDGHLFDIPELKILIDAVCSSKFITEKKSKRLIEKILTLAPRNMAAKLNRHISVENRVKSENESGYYIVDAINEAIDAGRMISFYYMDYDVNKVRYKRNRGEPYTVSPYTLIWDGDYYYLRGFCSERRAMRNFRLDRIMHQPIILDEMALPRPESYNLGEYSKAVFRMFDTDKAEEVTLRCSVVAMKAVIDQFGRNISTVPFDSQSFQVRVCVCTSPTFYRWVFGYGGNVKIIGPQKVCDEYLCMLRNAIKIQDIGITT